MVPPLVLVGPAEVMDNESPSGSRASESRLVVLRTRAWSCVIVVLVPDAVGGVFTTSTTLLVLPRKLVLPRGLAAPIYSALTVLEPCGRELVIRVATPLPSKSEERRVGKE